MKASYCYLRDVCTVPFVNVVDDSNTIVKTPALSEWTSLNNLHETCSFYLYVLLQVSQDSNETTFQILMMPFKVRTGLAHDDILYVIF